VQVDQANSAEIIIPISVSFEEKVTASRGRCCEEECKKLGTKSGHPKWLWLCASAQLRPLLHHWHWRSPTMDYRKAPRPASCWRSIHTGSSQCPHFLMLITKWLSFRFRENVHSSDRFNFEALKELVTKRLWKQLARWDKAKNISLKMAISCWSKLCAKGWLQKVRLITIFDYSKVNRYLSCSRLCAK